MSMKKVCGLIQCRLSSRRLPGKIFKKINGKILLDIQLERLKKSEKLDVIGILTTGSPHDDPIAEFCNQRDIYCFRGSERDVLDRYYKASRELDADVIVRITSDCPLLDPELVDKAVNTFLEYPGGVDYLGTTEPLPNTYPDGMDVSVFSMAALEVSWREAEKPSDREHVIFYMYNNPERFKVHRMDALQDWSSYRFCIDYPEDLTFLKQVWKELANREQFGNLDELIAIVDSDPKLKHINSQYTFGAGWTDSFNKDTELKESSAQLAPPLDCPKSEGLWPKVIKHVPGGAQTFSKMPNQFVNGVAPKLLYRGRGGRVWDLDGNEFIDFVLGLGPVTLGHCFKEVNEAAQLCHSDIFSTPSLPHPLETELSEKLCGIIPCAEMVRFGKNGSDATAGAVKLARAVTGREIIGCCGYHGWQDWYIGQTTRNRGILSSVGKMTIPFQYNDFESVKKIFKNHRNNVAALILEPVNFTPPQDDFLFKLRDICDHYGSLLIFDEVITGFRIPKFSAQSYFGVTPDLACFAKGISNGYPISAICGQEKYMSEFQDVFYSFTYAGELPSIAAALATIRVVERENVPDKINSLGNFFITGFNELLENLDIEFARAYGYGFWPKYDFDDTNGYSSQEILSLFQQEIVRRGILTRKTIFICFEHNICEIRDFLAAARKALLVVKKAIYEKKLKEWLAGDVIETIIRDPHVKH